MNLDRVPIDRLHSVAETFGGLPPWKKSLVMIAALFVMSGLLLEGIGALSGGSEREAVARERGARRSGSKDEGPFRPAEVSINPGAPDRAFIEEPDGVREPAGEEDSSLDLPHAERFTTPWSYPRGSDELEPTVERRRPPRGDWLSGTPGEEGAEGRGDAEGVDRWAPTLLRGGFSFFAALCIGFALRAFARISLIVLGSIFLTLSGLAYGGYITVHWEAIGEEFELLAESARSSAGGFSQFLRGSLPSAAMAGLGLLVGVKKK